MVQSRAEVDREQTDAPAGAEAALADVHALDRLDPYDAAARALIREASPALHSTIDAAAGAARALIDSDPRGQPILALLELEGLLDGTASIRRHLTWIAHARLTRQRQRTRARTVGQSFEALGVPLSVAVECMWVALRLMHKAVARLPWPHERRSALIAVLTARMREELKAQLDGQHEQTLLRHQLIVALERWRMEATDWPEFVTGAMRRLAGHLGIVALALGRPDNEARIVYEFTSSGFQPYFAAIQRLQVGSLTMDAHNSFGHSPQASAWRSRRIETNRSYRVDAGAAPWAPAAHEAGIYSSAALPIDDLGGEPVALLALYGRWPAQFEPDAMRLFLQALRQVFDQAFVELGRRNRAQLLPDEIRRGHLQLLSHGAVELAYQPIIELTGGTPVMVEALARLGDGPTALIQPKDFLTGFGRAELHRLFVLGLRMGLRQLALWDQQHIHLSLAVNLPPSVLVHPDCVQWVQDSLARAGIAPGRLALELLEDEETSATALRDIAIQRLAQQGVRLVMDDFGSGFSNLWRLRMLPFDSVKFDRQLLAGLDATHPKRRHFLAALLNVPRSLGLRTVLEGLETTSLVELAVQLGADAGQGYALSAPLHAAHVPQWMREFKWTPIDPPTPEATKARYP